MEIPSVAIVLIKKWEGLHKRKEDGLIYPYICPAGVWTIGYGSTRDFDNKPVTATTGPYTEEQCEELLYRDVLKVIQQILTISPTLVNNESAFGAIISFVYNLGSSRYYNSTLRRRINEGDWEEARQEIQRWIWAGGRRMAGLVARRQEEASYLYG